jgi:hypothetical protein
VHARAPQNGSSDGSGRDFGAPLGASGTGGFYFQDPATGSVVELRHQCLILYSVIMALFFVIIYLVNAITASRLQRLIDALEEARVE